jgi:hypothetical protein
MSLLRKKLLPLTLFLLLFSSLFPQSAKLQDLTKSALRFSISFPADRSKTALDGRLLLLIAKNNEREPRFQISEDLNTQQVFGVDVEGLKPDTEAIIDDSAFGSKLSNVPTVIL